MRALGCLRVVSFPAALACAIASVAAAAAPAQAAPEGEDQRQPALDLDGPFGVEAVAAADGVPCGGATEIGFILSVPANHHLYRDMIAVEPDGAVPDGVRFESVRLPEGDLEHEQVFPVRRREFRGPARVPVRVAVSLSATLEPPATIELRAAVRYQGCTDEGSCFGPGRDVSTFRLAILEPGATPRALRPDVFGDEVRVLPPSDVGGGGDGASDVPGGASQPPAQAGGDGESAGDGLASASPSPDAASGSGGSINLLDFEAIRARYGMGVVYLAVFWAGLLLCLTPCVFPMVTITASVFGSRVDKAGGGKLLRLASPVAYGLGIGLTYGVLGVAFALAGKGIGPGFALENPWVLGFIIAVFLGLALSMFGAYDIQPPKFILQRYDKAAQATGLVATFLMGLLGGLVAAPCAGPPLFALGALVAPTGDYLFGGSLFFVLGLGLAAPFMGLGLFAGLGAAMPRPGAWMLSVKKFFGVVMIGVALYLGQFLLKNLLGATGGTIHAWLVCAFLLVTGGFGGALDSLGKDAKPFDRVKRLFGVVCLAMGIYYLILIAGGAPPARAGGAGSGGEGAGAEHARIDWIASEEEGLALARREGKPALIDFYADWCPPCREMDERTFEDPRVIEAVRERFVAIRADVTARSEANDALKMKYQATPPLLVFFGSRGERVARPHGYIGGAVLDPEELIEILEAVR